MSELLFEKFWLLLLIALVVSGGVIYWAMQRRTKKLMRAAKVVPVVFAFLLALNVWVITEREAIREQTNQLIRVCEQGSAEALGAMLDPQFSAQGLSGGDFVEQVSEAFERLKIPNVTLLGVEIKPGGQAGKPVVKLVTFAHIVGKGGNDYGNVRSAWELTYIKRDTGWYLYELRPLSIQMKPVSDIREVMDSARFVN
jgi:hypothetical protein